MGLSRSCFVNKTDDRQAGQPIVMFGLNVLIGQSFLGPTPSTDDINTYTYI